MLWHKLKTGFNFSLIYIMSAVAVELVWKIKYWSGTEYLQKFNCESSRVWVHKKLYTKTLASLAKWHSRHIGLEYVSTTTPKFPWPHNFSAFLSCDELQIKRYHSGPNTLPFHVGYWGANTRTPGSDPSTCSSPRQQGVKYVFWELQFLRQCQFLLWGIPTCWWFHYVQERTCAVFVFYRHLSSVATYVLRMDIIVTTGYCMCTGRLLVKTQLQ